MTVSDFYELSTEEKANLCEAQVSAYCRVAAMEAGVILSDIEPDFLPEEQPELQNIEMYVVEGDDMPTGIAFNNKESAEDFISLDMVGVTSKYLGSGYSTTLRILRPLTGLTIRHAEEFITEAEYERAKVALDQYGNNVKHNKDLREALDKRSRDYDRASEYIWSDYREAKATLQKLEEIRTCWSEYQDLAKDFSSAVKFMMKAYTDSELIAEALGSSWNIEVVEA